MNRQVVRTSDGNKFWLSGACDAVEKKVLGALFCPVSENNLRFILSDDELLTLEALERRGLIAYKCNESEINQENSNNNNNYKGFQSTDKKSSQVGSLLMNINESNIQQTQSVTQGKNKAKAEKPVFTDDEIFSSITAFHQYLDNK